MTRLILDIDGRHSEVVLTPERHDDIADALDLMGVPGVESVLNEAPRPPRTPRPRFPMPVFLLGLIAGHTVTLLALELLS